MNSVVSELLKDVEIPKMFRVRQIFRTEQIDREKIPALTKTVWVVRLNAVWRL